MAYQVKRKKAHIIEHNFELIDDNDEVIETLAVYLVAEKCAKVFRERYLKLVKAQQELKNKQNDVDVLGEMGDAIISLFEVIFGEEQTQTLLKFYDNKYIEMLSDAMPFINEVVSPAINEQVKQYRKDLANNSNLNKKQKRKFGKM